MAKSKSTTVTTLRPQKDDARSTAARSELDREINGINAALKCATHALGYAQDHGDDELGAQAWFVIHDCSQRLGRFENALDNFWVRNNVTSREAVHG